MPLVAPHGSALEIHDGHSPRIMKPDLTDRLQKALSFCLLGWAFTLPISIAATQFFAYPASILALILWIRTRDKSLLQSPLFFPALLFLLAAILASSFGVRPGYSLWRTRRLALFLPLIFAVTTVSRRHSSGPFVLRIGAFFLTGCTLRAIYDAIRIPAGALRGEWIYGLGTMRDPQFYMVALFIAFAAWRLPLSRKKRIALLTAAVFCGVSFILHFKRGVWFSFAATLPLLALAARRVRPLLWLAVLAGLALALPQTRGRLQSLQTEFSVRKGGRWTLWTEVAPVLIRQHPMGMGISAVTNEDFRRVSKQMEPKLNHLHNNVLQVLLETGWIGLTAWLVWMTAVLRLMVRNVRGFSKEKVLPRMMAIAILSSFLGLMLNGLVEYNFGDSEIFMLLCLAMGASDALRVPDDEQSLSV